MNCAIVLYDSFILVVGLKIVDIFLPDIDIFPISLYSFCCCRRGEGDRDVLRGVRRAGDRPAHPHHREVIQQLLRAGEAEGEARAGARPGGGHLPRSHRPGQ